MTGHRCRSRLAIASVLDVPRQTCSAGWTSNASAGHAVSQPPLGGRKPSPLAIALLQRPLEQVPPRQSELELHDPHLPLEHVPTLQSELELHDPHLPPEHVPLPLQSELELHDPHLPPEHVPSLQSELELHAPHLPLEHVPWP